MISTKDYTIQIAKLITTSGKIPIDYWHFSRSNENDIYWEKDNPRVFFPRIILALVKAEADNTCLKISYNFTKFKFNFKGEVNIFMSNKFSPFEVNEKILKALKNAIWNNLIENTPEEYRKKPGDNLSKAEFIAPI